MKACPRRFALTRATYAQIWQPTGYPVRIADDALVGIVIHKVVETVLGGFHSAGCASVADELSISVIRDLGGYTSIVSAEVGKAIERLQANPRMESQLDHVDVRLRQRIPEMRVAVQKLIARTSLVNSEPRVDGGGNPWASRVRGRISGGSHPEVTLVAEVERFTGRVDLVTVRDDSVDLLDFKSGKPSHRHSWQLTLYGLLWASDTVANPDRLPVRALTVVYPDADQPVAVPRQWQAVRVQLGGDIERGERALAEMPPKANPSAECRYCPVRHMCDEYWASPFTRRDGVGSSFTDIEVLVQQRNGPRSWKVRLVDDSSDILLRTSSEDGTFAPGQRLRILDIVLSDSGDTDWKVTTAVAGTEVYTVAGGTRQRAVLQS